MYLKGFFDPKRVAKGVNSLWRYRPDEKPAEKGTKKIAEQTNFYDLPEVDQADNDIEEMFSKVEGSVAQDLKKLRAGKIDLKPQERGHLAGYFALQYARTPWFRELTNQSVIGLQLALLKERFEKPGEVEKLIEEMRARAGQGLQGRRLAVRSTWPGSSRARSPWSRRTRPGTRR